MSIVWSLAQSVLGTLAFMGLSLTIGRRLVFIIIRWVNDIFVSDFAVITAILLIMCVMALITDLIGVHTVLGAFVAGILVGESPILTRHIDEQLRGLIIAFFMPVFFATAGLSRRPDNPKGYKSSASHLRPDRNRKYRQIRRRLRRRRSCRAYSSRVAGARDRHERARLDRGDRRNHRPVDGCAEPEPVHDDRHNGRSSRLWRCRRRCVGRSPLAASQGGKGTARTRGQEAKGFVHNLERLLRRGRRQRQRQVRLRGSPA